MRILTFSEARNNLKQVLDQVEQDADVAIVTRRDAGDVVVMSLATFNSWRETVHLLSSPVNARRLGESIAQLRDGKGRVRPLVEPADSDRPAGKTRVRSSKSVAKAAKQAKPGSRRHA